MLDAVVIIAVACAAFLARGSTGPAKLIDPDSVYMLRIADIFLKDGGTGESTPHTLWHLDPLSYHPDVRDLRFEELLLPWSGARLFPVAAWFYVDRGPEAVETFLFTLMKLWTAVSAAMVYVMIRIMAPPLVALGVAMTYAVAPAVFVKTWPGSFDKECLAGLLAFMTLAAFFKVVQERSSLFPRFVWAFAGGGAFALLKLTWGGYQFFSGVMALFVYSYFLLFSFSSQRDAEARNLSLAFVIIYVFGTIAAWSIAPLACPLLNLSNPGDAAAAIALVPAVLSLFFRTRPARSIAFFFLVVLIPFVLLLCAGKDRLLSVALRVLQPDTTARYIDEFQAGTWSLLKYYFGPMAYVTPLGFVITSAAFIRRRSWSAHFMLVWLLSSLMCYFWRKRFVYVLPVPLSFAVFHGFYEIQTYASRGIIRLGVCSRLAAAAATTTICCALGIYFFLADAGLCRKVQQVLKDKLEVMESWRGAAEWIRDHTPENALLISWWDYGYHLQTFARRTTIVDPGNREETRNQDVARMFTHTEQAFETLISRYNPGRRPVYVLISLGEIWKGDEINDAARDDLTLRTVKVPFTGDPEKDEEVLKQLLSKLETGAFYQTDQLDHYLFTFLQEEDEMGNLRPEWRNKLIIQLLPFQTADKKSLSGFEQVFTNGTVYVYEYRTPES